MKPSALLAAVCTFAALFLPLALTASALNVGESARF